MDDCNCCPMVPTGPITLTILPGPFEEPDWEMVRLLNPGLMATLTYTDPESGLELSVEMDPERAAQRWEELTGRSLYPGSEPDTPSSSKSS